VAGFDRVEKMKWVFYSLVCLFMRCIFMMIVDYGVVLLGICGVWEISWKFWELFLDFWIQTKQRGTSESELQ
jgi:hypothetical protein